MLYSFLGFLHTSSVLPSSIWNAETSPSEAQTEKAASFWKKHERQNLKARQLFQKAGGLLGKRRRAFHQKAAAFLPRGRNLFWKHLKRKCFFCWNGLKKHYICSAQDEEYHVDEIRQT